MINVPHTVLIAMSLASFASGLKCNCDGHLSPIDDQMKEYAPDLRTPVCVEGTCDITAAVPSGYVPLCSYFDSEYRELSGYYCSAGANADPSTQVVKEMGNIEIKMTHCTSDLCDPKPADATEHGPPPPRVTSLECKCDGSLSQIDGKMKEKIPDLKTPVCVEGKCNIASQLTMGIPLCTYFNSEYSMLTGYYCSLGLNDKPSTMIVKELGNAEVHLTHCTTDNCDPMPESLKSAPAAGAAGNTNTGGGGGSSGSGAAKGSAAVAAPMTLAAYQLLSR